MFGVAQVLLVYKVQLEQAVPQGQQVLLALQGCKEVQGRKALQEILAHREVQVPQEQLVQAALLDLQDHRGQPELRVLLEQAVPQVAQGPKEVLVLKVLLDLTEQPDQLAHKGQLVCMEAQEPLV